ncbi:T9SS type A sorting domain-containing protein [Aequorivita viscosa]|nr:T9SS type A sorting domain-containing protein [Aequorivita viscosa]
MKKTTTLLAIFLSLYTMYAQDPNILWQRTIGGSNWDEPTFTIATIDDGFLMGGNSKSNISGEKTEDSRGGKDFWVLKFNNAGNIEWQKTIGGNQEEFLADGKQTADGGYILAGYSNSDISGEKTENSQGGYDYWVVKIDANGTIEWQNTIGGNGEDKALTIEITADSGYLIGGTSTSGISGDRTIANIGTNASNIDTWIIKLNENGAIEWQRAYDIQMLSLKLTNDGGYVIGSPGSYPYDGLSYFIMKINSNGNTIWEKTYGGDGGDLFKNVIITSDGGYMALGSSMSDASGDKTEGGRGSWDYWVLKLNADGIVEWDKTLGGSADDFVYNIIQTQDNGYIVTGDSFSNISGDKSEDTEGQDDFWIIKLNAVGIIEGQNTIGGRYNDRYPSVLLTPNETFTIAGASTSNISGDKTENSRGGNDYWIIHHEEILGITENAFNNTISLYPNPTKNTLHINTQNQSIDQINIYSILGNRVRQLEVDTVSPTVDVSSLAAGIYYIQLYSGKNVALKKFVKE